MIKLISNGTIEERISDLQDKKRLLIEEVIDSEGAKKVTLTEVGLKELLSV